MKTIKQLTREVEDVQNACNLSGVLHGAAAAAVSLRAVLPSMSTGGINRHPIMRAWAYKIGDLSGLFEVDVKYPTDELRLLLEAPDTAQDLIDAAA